jgi:hypothetical protein
MADYCEDNLFLPAIDITQSEIDAGLAPLSHAECEGRGIRHSSTDDQTMVEIRRAS